MSSGSRVGESLSMVDTIEVSRLSPGIMAKGALFTGVEATIYNIELRVILAL